MSTWVLCGPETKPNVSSSVAHFAASYRYCVIVCVCVCNVPCLHESISSKPVVTWLYSSHYGLLSMYWNAGVVRNVIDVCKVAWQERQKKRRRTTQDALVRFFFYLLLSLFWSSASEHPSRTCNPNFHNWATYFALNVASSQRIAKCSRVHHVRTTTFV